MQPDNATPQEWVKVGRRWLAIGGLISCLAAPGCRSSPARQPSAESAPPGPRGGMVGRVVRVNSELGYAVVHGQDLPSAGEQAKVFREEREVAVLRFDGATADHLATPDIVSGEPRPGDRVVRK